MLSDAHTPSTNALHHARRPTVECLRGSLWLNYALYRSGLDLKTFAKEHIEQDRNRYTDSKLVYKWQRFERLPTARWISKIDLIYPGTRQVFHLPLYELLKSPISHKGLEQCIEQHYVQRGSTWSQWHFPNTDEQFTLVHDWDTSLFVDRGDLWGLFAIIALARRAELHKDTTAHLACCKDMYRILPALFKQTWIQPAKDLLKACLFEVRQRVSSSVDRFAVDWKLIDELAASSSYRSRRIDRPRDSKTLRFIEYPDPIIDPWATAGHSAHVVQDYWAPIIAQIGRILNNGHR